MNSTSTSFVAKSIIFVAMEMTAIKKHLEDNAHKFLLSVHKGGENSKEAARIIKKYMLTQHITSEEEKVLKVQMADSLKVIGVAVPFILLPGAAIIMPILINAARKHNIDLLPSFCD